MNSQNFDLATLEFERDKILDEIEATNIKIYEEIKAIERLQEEISKTLGYINSDEEIL